MVQSPFPTQLCCKRPALVGLAAEWQLTSLPAFLGTSAIPCILSSWWNWQIASFLVLSYRSILGGGSRFSLVPSPNLQHSCAAGRIWGHIQWRASFPTLHTPPFPPIPATCSTAQRHRDTAGDGWSELQRLDNTLVITRGLTIWNRLEQFIPQSILNTIEQLASKYSWWWYQ